MSSAANAGNGGVRSRILLVEDQNSVRNSLYTVLGDAGYDVLAASDGAEGLSIFRQSTRPIELTDYHMPQKGRGDDPLRKARELLPIEPAGRE